MDNKDSGVFFFLPSLSLKRTKEFLEQSRSQPRKDNSKFSACECQQILTLCLFAVNFIHTYTELL